MRGNFPFMSMGGLAEGLACADPGASTPIGMSGNFLYFLLFCFGILTQQFAVIIVLVLFLFYKQTCITLCDVLVLVNSGHYVCLAACLQYLQSSTHSAKYPILVSENCNPIEVGANHLIIGCFQLEDP